MEMRNGICEECRKQKYCSHKCKAYNNREKYEIENVFWNFMYEKKGARYTSLLLNLINGKL